MARPRKNNANYFSHDNNMRNHRKIKALRNKFGLEGYAVFNMFLETLTESDGFEIKLKKSMDWELLAADFGVDRENLEIIIDYCVEIELIIMIDRCIYKSENLCERLAPVLELREKKREWADKRWNNEDKIELKNTKTEFSTPKTMQTKLNKTKLNKTKENTEFSNENCPLSETSSEIEELVYEPLEGEEIKKRPKKVWNNQDYINSLVNSKREDLKIIGKYMLIKKMKLPSAVAAKAEVSRCIRSAIVLAEYSPERRKIALLKAQKMTNQWTLETCIKYLNK